MPKTADYLTCDILTAKETLFSDKIGSLTIPSAAGEMEILPDHAESFILLKSGSLILERKAGIRKKLLVTSGLCYVKDNLIKVLLSGNVDSLS